MKILKMIAELQDFTNIFKPAKDAQYVDMGTTFRHCYWDEFPSDDTTKKYGVFFFTGCEGHILYVGEAENCGLESAIRDVLGTFSHEGGDGDFTLPYSKLKDNTNNNLMRRQLQAGEFTIHAVTADPTLVPLLGTYCRTWIYQEDGLLPEFNDQIGSQ